MYYLILIRYKHYNGSADDQARFLFLKMSKEERKDLLRRSLEFLLSNYHLFIKTRHWLSIFLVVRDRLVGNKINQSNFVAFAREITPEDWPLKLRIGENTYKNFGREISNLDRSEAYYDMTSNPQQDICDTYWEIVKNMILTEK